MRLALPLAAILALSDCASVQADTLEGAHYVAMGSSFAAGAGIGPLKEGSPGRCGRTQNNYAALLAEELKLALTDASCGGARTEHVLEAWDELPAQIDAVSADTRLVTITVGGNDLDYMGLLFSASCDPATGMVRNGEVLDCPVRVGLPDEGAYQATEATLGEIVRQVRERAPQARVIFVQYVTLVPERPCRSLLLDETARTEARVLAARLARITANAALANGVEVLDADRLSAAHTACDAENWSRAFDPAYDGSSGAPWHPTAEGHAAIAELLAAMLEDSA